MADGALAVVGTGLSKKYQIYSRPFDRFLEAASRWRSKRHVDVWALRDVDLEIPAGTTYGIVGKNGSGKSTLLQLICGVLRPTSGRIRVNGRITAILELGAGFNPDFTGRENIMIYGALMGVAESTMKARIGQIVEFAGIGEFLDLPVRTYSSGMYVRLAFATAINLDPDILVVDEVLAVGDAQFQHRCVLKVRELQAAGKTIIFVSHDTSAVRALCQQAMLLENGAAVATGAASDIIDMYYSRLSTESLSLGDVPASAEVGGREGTKKGIVEAFLAPETHLPNVDGRYGDGSAHIVGVGIYDGSGRHAESVDHGQPLAIRVTVSFREAVRRPILGFILRDRLGQEVLATNSAMEEVELPAGTAGSMRTYEFVVQMPLLQAASYAVSVAVADGDLHEYRMCDWIDNAASVQLLPTHKTASLIRCPVSIRVGS